VAAAGVRSGKMDVGLPAIKLAPIAWTLSEAISVAIKLAPFAQILFAVRALTS